MANFKNVFVLAGQRPTYLTCPFVLACTAYNIANRMHPPVFAALLSAGLACVVLILALASSSDDFSKKVAQYFFRIGPSMQLHVS